MEVPLLRYVFPVRRSPLLLLRLPVPCFRNNGWNIPIVKEQRITKVRKWCILFEVRLVGGTAPHEGRVEILYNGVWGTICHDYWELPEANVVCHQLGFDGAVLALHSAAYGEGTGVIWMDDIHCIGIETAISQCAHQGWRVMNCAHNQDASVICKPKGVMTLPVGLDNTL